MDFASLFASSPLTAKAISIEKNDCRCIGHFPANIFYPEIAQVLAPDNGVLILANLPPILPLWQHFFTLKLLKYLLQTRVCLLRLIYQPPYPFSNNLANIFTHKLLKYLLQTKVCTYVLVKLPPTFGKNLANIFTQKLLKYLLQTKVCMFQLHFDIHPFLTIIYHVE